MNAKTSEKKLPINIGSGIEWLFVVAIEGATIKKAKPRKTDSAK